MTVKSVGALLLAVGALLVGGGAVPASVAPTTSAAASTRAPLEATGVHAAAATSTGVDLTASPDDLTALGAGGTLHLTATLTNGGTTAIEQGRLLATVNRTPLASTAALGSWLAGSTGSTSATSTVAREISPALAPGESGSVAFSVPVSALHFGAAGVYAIAVSLDTAGTTTPQSRTAVVYKTGAAHPVPLAIAMPLVLPADVTGLLTSAQLEQFTSPTGVLTQQLDAVINSPVAIGIDPRIIASIRVLGTAAPRSAREWLDRLRTASNDTFALPWADSDITLALQAGARVQLAPTSFDFAIDPSRFAAAETTSPTPTVTPAPNPTTTPTLPTAADLVAWDYTLPDVSWPAARTVSSSDLSTITRAGAKTVILASSNVAGVTGASGSIGNTRVAVADARLTALLSAAITAPTQAAYQAAVARLTATVAVESATTSRRAPALLATLPRSWDPVNSRIAQTLNTLFVRPWTTNVSVASALASTPTPLKLVNRRASDERIALVKLMLTAESRVGRFSEIVADPVALTASRRLIFLSLLSDAWLADPAGWNVAVHTFLDDSQAILRSVQVTKSSTINFLNDRGALPVTVDNELNQAVTVYVRVRPQTALVTVDEPNVKLVIQPDAQRRVNIPIQSLSNGSVQLSVTLYSGPSIFSRPVGSPALLKLNVNAGWETAGTVVFAVLVVGVFIFGIIRNIRKRRKAARE